METTTPKALIVIGATMLIGPLLYSGSLTPSSPDDLSTFLLVCMVVPGLGVMLMVVGVILYIPARKVMREIRITMADGRKVTPAQLNATIPDGMVRELTPLEKNAKEWGFTTWDPRRGNYDAYEIAALTDYISRHRGESRLSADWFERRGFRRVAIYTWRHRGGHASGRMDWSSMSDERQGWVLVGLGVLSFALGVVLTSALLIVGGIFLMIIGRIRMPGPLFGTDD